MPRWVQVQKRFLKGWYCPACKASGEPARQQSRSCSGKAHRERCGVEVLYFRVPHGMTALQVLSENPDLLSSWLAA